MGKATTKAELKELCDLIQAKTGKTVKEISTEAGYAPSTITQYFHRETGHEKVINRLKHKFATWITKDPDTGSFHMGTALEFYEKATERIIGLEREIAKLKGQNSQIEQHIILSLDSVEERQQKILVQLKVLMIFLAQKLPGDEKENGDKINSLLHEFLHRKGEGIHIPEHEDSQRKK